MPVCKRPSRLTGEVTYAMRLMTSHCTRAILGHWSICNKPLELQLVIHLTYSSLPQTTLERGQWKGLRVWSYCLGRKVSAPYGFPGILFLSRDRDQNDKCQLGLLCTWYHNSYLKCRPHISTDSFQPAYSTTSSHLHFHPTSYICIRLSYANSIQLSYKIFLLRKRALPDTAASTPTSALPNPLHLHHNVHAPPHQELANPLANLV